MSKRGSAIVESVMIFPLVVMSAVILIFIMIYFHTQICERVDMHIMLRAESGKLCENMFYQNDINSDFTVYKEAHQIYSKKRYESEGNLLLDKNSKEIYARKYLVDEVKYIRMTGVIEE